MAEYITVQEAAAYLSMSITAVRRLVYARKVRFHRLPGGGLRFKRHDLDAYMRLHAQDVGF